MRRMRWNFRILSLLLRTALLSLTIRAVFQPYFPYIKFVWRERRTLRQVWQEIQAIQSNS